MIDHVSRPWLIPVPLRESTFQSLYKKHQFCNVEVDLGKIRAFIAKQSSQNEFPILYSDYQCNADGNIYHRSGSGRSGFHQGQYIKGVGRTLLATNWNEPLDLYHNSGMQLPSAAIREYVVTKYVQLHNKEYLINPCNGLLFKKLEGEFRNHQREVFQTNLEENPQLQLANVNNVLQAITVKEGNFSRFSNFVWWLSYFSQHQGSHHSLFVANFFESFWKGITGFNNHETDVDAELISKKFLEMIQKTINNFLEAWSLGINWGSLHNNFTMDGRFLDLETPTVFPYRRLIGHHFVGHDEIGTPETIQIDNYQHFVGFEVLGFVKQMQRFIIFFDARLAFLTKNRYLSKSEVEFVGDFLESLRKGLKKNHPVYSRKILVDQVSTYMTSVLNLSAKLQRKIYAMLSFATQDWLFEKEKTHVKKSNETFFRMKLKNIAPTEPSSRTAVYIPEFFMDLYNDEYPPAIYFNETLNKLDCMENPDEIFEFLSAKLKFPHAQ